MVINSQKLLDIQPPILHPMSSKKHKYLGVSFGMSEAGYDIRIKQSVRFDRSSVDGNWFTEVRDPSNDTGLTIGDNRFALASSVEEFEMPPNLMAIVHDKSTWARRGLSVFNTVIEPGWKGFLTLELVNHSNQPLFIPAGTGIAQVIFHEVAVPVEYTGKYQNQADRPVSAINSI